MRAPGSDLFFEFTPGAFDRTGFRRSSRKYEGTVAEVPEIPGERPLLEGKTHRPEPAKDVTRDACAQLACDGAGTRPPDGRSHLPITDITGPDAWKRRFLGFSAALLRPDLSLFFLPSATTLSDDEAQKTPAPLAGTEATE